jgi:hypothetical protein
MMRVIGIILIGVAVLYLGIGIDGLLNAGTKGRFVATVADAFGQRIDPTDWARHWFVTSVEMAVVGGLIAIAGCGIWQRRAGALLLLAGTLAAQLVWQLVQYLIGYSKYAFEAADPVSMTLYAIAIAGAAVGFARLRRNVQVDART